MLVADLAYVGTYGSNVPSWDDWDMVPTLVGEDRVTAAWLWSQHNEHRVPLPRLILLGLGHFIGRDFRVGMVFNVAALGVAAFAMILAAKQLRGRTHFSDAFFPLVLLHAGHGINLLWSWQVQFLSSTVLATIVLLLIVQSRPRLRIETAIAIGTCLILLPLCGANGVALVPALALWLGYSGGLNWYLREPRYQRNSIMMWVLASTALVVVGVYLFGWEKVPYHPSSPGVVATLTTSLQFLTMGFGPAVRSIWPLSGIGALCVLLFSATLAIVAWRNQPEERFRAAGLLCFMGAMTSLAFGLGLGRGGFETRYVTLAVPYWCGIYLVWSLYGRDRVRRYGQLLLLGAAVCALVVNTPLGIAYGSGLRHVLGSFESDMEAGVPSHMLIRRYGEYLHPHHDIPSDYLPMLKRAGVGQFRLLQEDPVFREISLALTPVKMNQVVWEDGIARGVGNDPYLVFDLPQEMYVSGIRLRYSYWDEGRSLPYVTVYWKSSAQDGFTKDQWSKYSPTGDRANWAQGTWLRRTATERTFTIWVCSSIDQLRIQPDVKPGAMRVSDIVLLVPPAGP